MKKIINNLSQEIIGELSSLDKIKDYSKRFMLEPFVTRHNYFVYKDDEGKFGVCSPDSFYVAEVTAL